MSASWYDMVGTEVLERIARAVAQERDLEHLVPALLDVLTSTTGLESSYLALLDPDREELEVRWSHSQGVPVISEGERYPWTDTLARPVVVGPAPPATIVPGISTLLSVPVATADGTLIATICGGSPRAVDLGRDAIAVAEVLARLIGDQASLDQATGAAREMSDTARLQALTAQQDAQSSRLALRDALLRFRGRLREADSRIEALRERLAHSRRGEHQRDHPSPPPGLEDS